MQLLLKGKRAINYLGLAKNRMRALRQSNAGKWAAKTTILADGEITVKKLDQFDRISINVRDPHIIIDVLKLDESSTLRYLAHEGGISGEYFARNVLKDPPEIAGAPVAQAVLSWVTMGSNAYGFFTLSTDMGSPLQELHPSEQVAIKANLLTSATYMTSEVNSLVNNQGLSVNAYAPIGRLDSGAEYMAMSIFSSTTKDDTNSRAYVYAVRNDVDEPKTQVWPISGVNGGNLGDCSYIGCMANAGRNKVAWFAEYIDTVSPAHTADSPELVVYDHALGTYTRTALNTLVMPADPAHAKVLGQNKGIAYCGNNTLLMAFKYLNDPAGVRVYRSVNSGSSWSVVSPGHASNELVVGGLYNEHGLKSLKPGHVMLMTHNGGSYYLHYSGDYGATWARRAINLSNEARDIGRYVYNLCAVAGKRGAMAYVGTLHETSSHILLAVFDDFHPDANHLGDVTVTNVAEEGAATFFTSASFFDPAAPLLQGYPGELEGV